jgi:hypothetical protein
MKALNCIVATVALLISGSAIAPAMAQQFSGGGSTSLWSSAQGTSDSYGSGAGFATSQSGSMTTAGGLGFSNLAGGNGYGGGAVMSAFTASNAGASTNGNGYAQVQTSGYAGGSVTGFGARTH